MSLQTGLFAGHSDRRLGYSLRPVHVRYVLEKVALGQVFVRALMFSPVTIIPSQLHSPSVDAT